MDRDVERARFVTSDSRSIPLDIDSAFWKGETDAVPYRKKWTSSYVLLAACGADETAREVKNSDGRYGGRFTTALIPLMRHASLDQITLHVAPVLGAIGRSSTMTPRPVNARSF